MMKNKSKDFPNISYVVGHVGADLSVYDVENIEKVLLSSYQADSWERYIGYLQGIYRYRQGTYRAYTGYIQGIYKVYHGFVDDFGTTLG